MHYTAHSQIAAYTTSPTIVDKDRKMNLTLHSPKLHFDIAKIYFRVCAYKQTQTRYLQGNYEARGSSMTHEP